MSSKPYMLRLSGVLLWAAAVACPGCRPSAQTARESEEPKAAGEQAMKLTITSSAFDEGQVIPKQHTGDGQDLSPALAWSGVPVEAQELALICDDPDAPRPDPWVHWVIYGISASVTGFPEGIATQASLTEPAKMLQGKNSWGTIGYRGPAPPRGHGVHHYHFKLYALDVSVDLLPALTKDELLTRIKSHIIAEGELIGTYQR